MKYDARLLNTTRIRAEGFAVELTSMRILYCSFDQVPSPKGASRHIEEWVTALGAYFGDVTLVTPGLVDATNAAFAPGVKQIVLGAPGDNPIARARIFRVKLAGLLREESFNVAHFRSLWEGLPLVAWKEQTGGLLVHEVNGLPSVELKYHYARLADAPEMIDKLGAQENQCLAAADQIITVSEVNRQSLLARGVPAEKVQIIRNGVALAEFPFRLPPRLNSPELRIAYVGTFTWWQGIETLIEAAAMVARHRPVRVSLMGMASRTRRQQLEELIAHLRMTSAVEFLEPGSTADVVRLLHRSHLAAVPLLAVDRNTRQGCCPLKLLEAMAAGCPVIASNLAVVRELAEPDVHFIPARAGDARQWKNQILRYCENYDRAEQLARTAREHVARNFTWEEANRRLIGLYDELLLARRCVQ